MALGAGSAGAIAAAIGVPITMRLLAKLFPAKPTPEVGLSPEELRACYRKWELGLRFTACLLAVPLGFAFWYALRTLAAAHAALLPRAELQWVAGTYYWAIPALFLAIVAVMPVFDWISRALLRERYTQFLAYQALRTGMDVNRVGRLLGTTTGIACAVFIFLGLDWWVRVEPDAVVLNRYLSVGEERYAFRDVRSIRTAPALVAPNGNVVFRREFVVRFADGRSWTTNSVLSNSSEADKRRLAALLSARSGVPVEEVEVFGKDEL